MPESLTLYEVGNGIAVLTLNNPLRRNALSFATMDEILGHLERVEKDDEARVVVIRAEGRCSVRGTTCGNCRKGTWRTRRCCLHDALN